MGALEVDVLAEPGSSTVSNEQGLTPPLMSQPSGSVVKTRAARRLNQKIFMRSGTLMPVFFDMFLAACVNAALNADGFAYLLAT
ncbi:hypothetical protein ACPCSE_16430 [Streptomyces cellulosae]